MKVENPIISKDQKLAAKWGKPIQREILTVAGFKISFTNNFGYFCCFSIFVD